MKRFLWFLDDVSHRLRLVPYGGSIWPTTWLCEARQRDDCRAGRPLH